MRTRTRAFAAFTAAATLLPVVYAGTAHAQAAAAVPQLLRGAHAVEQLGTRAGVAAARYRMDISELDDLLSHDEAAFMTSSGLLGYEEEAPTQAPASTTVPPTGADAPTNATEAFNLSSLPGAKLTIYLDFNGHSTTGTAWNSAVTNGAAINSAAFDIDGQPTNWNIDEISAIYTVWKGVSEDYAPFQVNVTTKDPGTSALAKTTSDDLIYGVRVVVSPTSSWYSTPPPGGIAFVGSFNWSTDTPAFCFSDALYNDGGFLAECVAHEAGHTVGLSHDGTSTKSYYMGHGSWAPIMGVGYYETVTQWSKGEYTDANNTEDDLAIIGSAMPYRSDDHGGTSATATVVGANSTAYGVIATRTDTDAFAVTASGVGSLTVTAAPLHDHGNLDIALSVYDSNGVKVATGDGASLSATATANVVAGTYTVIVDGVGSANPASTGYSDYGSIGEYAVNFATTITNSAPIAKANASSTSGTVPLAVNFTSTGSSDPDGGALTYTWQITSGSTVIATASGPSTSYTFTSAGTFNATLTATDTGGLSDTDTVTITASGDGSVNITADTVKGYGPLTVTFSSAGSSLSGGGTLTYSWDFGDGATSTAANPTHTYTEPGTYTAALTIANAKTNATGSIIVTVDNRNPTAAAAATTTTGFSPLTTTFSATASSDLDGDTLSYSWEFLVGSNVTATATGISATRTFSGPGTYTARLTVTDSRGGSDTDTVTVTVVNRAPVAVLAASTTSGTAPMLLVLSSSDSYDPDGYSLTYRWDFSVGGASLGSATTASMTATLNSPGTYDITLTVTDPQGGTGTDTLTITVAASGPTAKITASKSSGAAPLPVTFSSAGSLNPTGGTLTYAWQVRLGTTLLSSATTANLAYTFPKQGTYTVTLTVKNSAGATGSASTTVAVSNGAPVAKLTPSATKVNTKGTVTFSSTGSSDPEGGALKYRWRIVNSAGTQLASSTASGFSYTFASPGAYPVSLAVTDAAGVTTTSTTTIYVGYLVATVSLAKTATLTGTATVKCVSAATGKALPYVAFTAVWYRNGVVVATYNGRTDGYGVARIARKLTAAGTLSIKVTKVTLSLSQSASWRWNGAQPSAKVWVS